MTLRENNTVIAWVSILLGVIFIVNPGGTGKVIVWIAGAGVLVAGIVDIIRRFTADDASLPNDRKLGGIVKIILGIFILTHTGIVLTLLSYILGVMILIGGSRNLDRLLRQRHEGVVEKNGNLRILWSILLIAAGIFMLFFPFGAVNAAILIVGIILVLYGVAELYTSQRGKSDEL